jgi:hypothetical protein
MTAPFNPHSERTSDGTLIVPGLRVIDYNMRTGTVVADRDATEYKCSEVEGTLVPTSTGMPPPCHNGWDKPTHWFDVKGTEPGDGHGGMFDGSRMKAIR